MNIYRDGVYHSTATPELYETSGTRAMFLDTRQVSGPANYSYVLRSFVGGTEQYSDESDEAVVAVTAAASGTVIPPPVLQSVVRYSSSSGEIIWVRATTQGMEYEVTFDDAVNAVQAVSFYAGDLDPSREYPFSVVAVLGDHRSEPVTGILPLHEVS